jgi:hypothetical protein
MEGFEYQLYAATRRKAGLKSVAAILQHRPLICKIETLKLSVFYPSRSFRKFDRRKKIYVTLYIASTRIVIHPFCNSLVSLRTTAGGEQFGC